MKGNKGPEGLQGNAGPKGPMVGQLRIDNQHKIYYK